MTEKERLLELHLAAARARDAALRALGLSIRVQGNGISTSCKKAWEAACEAEEAVHLRIVRSSVIQFRSRKS